MPPKSKQLVPPHVSAPLPRAWQRMLSGRRLDLLDPSPFDVEIGDIAHGLARLARWNGQTKGAHSFSVAQHSVLVEDIAARLKPNLPDASRLAILLHDAPEYVIGDLISPFKAAVGMNYKALELRLQSAIHLRFGLPPELPPAVSALAKKADKIAAYYEATELAGFSEGEAKRFFGDPLAAGLASPDFLLPLEPWPTASAELTFRSRFAALAGIHESASHDR